MDWYLRKQLLSTHILNTKKLKSPVNDNQTTVDEETPPHLLSVGSLFTFLKWGGGCGLLPWM